MPINPSFEIEKIFDAARPDGNGAKAAPEPIKAPPRYKSAFELWAEDCVASPKVAAKIRELNEEIYDWTFGVERLNYREQQKRFLQAVSDAVADLVYDGVKE